MKPNGITAPLVSGTKIPPTPSNDGWSVCRSPNEIGEAMITWTHIQKVDGKNLESVDGKNVETHSSLSLGNFEWSVAWLASIGSFGSFLVSLAQAFGLWH
jgi:hypothetical protein